MDRLNGHDHNGFDPRFSWSVACTLPRRESGARERLVQLGFSVYLPMWTKPPTRRCEVPTEPLFPGYLFLHCNGCKARPQDVESVSRLMLAPGGGMAEIPGTDLLWLWEAEQAGLLQERPRSIASDPNGVAKLVPGSQLRALAGPFSGFPCALQSSDGLERCRVLFDLFGRQTSVEMALADVAAIG